MDPRRTDAVLQNLVRTKEEERAHVTWGNTRAVCINEEHDGCARRFGLAHQ